MTITAVKYEGGQLIIDTVSPEARRIPYKFKPGEYDLVKAKNKRSLEANAYLWRLAEEISRVVGISKEDIYRRNIREAGEFYPLPIKAEAVEDFSRIWSERGIGWFCDVVDDSKLTGYKIVHAYRGSSTYTVQEMSRLIDAMIQDAKSVGIEVISEREKSLLLEDWGK